jgi:hypothetical protein
MIQNSSGLTGFQARSVEEQVNLERAARVGFMRLMDGVRNYPAYNF